MRFPGPNTVKTRWDECRTGMCLTINLLVPGKDESEFEAKGDFEQQCKEGWTPPFQQVLLNMHRRGLRVCFRQLPTSALPASHVKHQMLQEASSGSDLESSNMMILWPSAGQCSQRRFTFFFFFSTPFIALIPGLKP